MIKDCELSDYQKIAQKHVRFIRLPYFTTEKQIYCKRFAILKEHMTCNVKNGYSALFLALKIMA